jgi:hypothetical protein
MSAKKHPHAWSAESLLCKAQRYATTMLEKERTDWQFGFWSALTLEMLARAAVAKISPTLLAHSNNWNNTYYALGQTATESRYVPRSIDIAEVFNRLKSIFPDNFTQEVHNFYSNHINLRNTEMHSGDLPFDVLGTSSWLAKYYLTCQVLLHPLGQKLDILLGTDEAKVAETLIQALEDSAAKAVGTTIEDHKKAWRSKTDKERKSLARQAQTLTSRHVGHRIKCPSCGNTALIHGNPLGAPTQKLEDDIITERQSMLPSHFECLACGLKIIGYSKLAACGLGDAFTATSQYEAAEYFDIAEAAEMYEGDFNE